MQHGCIQLRRRMETAAFEAPIIMTATGTTMGANELFHSAPIAARAGRFTTGKTTTMVLRTTKREGLDRLHLTKAFQPSRANWVEKMVAAAVLCQAAEDLQKFRDERRPAGQMLYNEVRDWVTANDTGWPGSFLNVCRALQLAPQSVRTGLLADETLSKRRGKDIGEPLPSAAASGKLRFFEMSGGKSLRKGQNTKPKTRA
jgi:hypothetical protein